MQKMNFILKLLISTFSIILVGCAHAPKIDFQQMDRSLLSGKTIGVVTLPPPDLTVATAGGAAYSALAKLPASAGHSTAK
jgi:hypothetical protein